MNTSAFDHIPSEELYIFPTNPPSRADDGTVGPNGAVPNPFTFKFSQVDATPVNGGSVKVVDTRTFPISKTISGALVTVNPGGIRELHVSLFRHVLSSVSFNDLTSHAKWHPTQPEWSYFL